MKNSLKLTLPALLLVSTTTQGALTWTGVFPTSGNLATKFAALADLDNYSGDKTGLTEAFDDNDGINFSLNNFTTDVTFDGVNFGTMNVNLRTLPGNTLTLTNSQLTLSGNAGISTLGGSGEDNSFLTMQNSSVNVAAISNGLAATLDQDALLTLRGSATPVNSFATIDLDPGGTVTFTGNPGNPGAAVISNTAFPGSLASNGDTSQFEYTGDYPGNFNGNGSIIALSPPPPVPEPSTALILGLAFPVLLGRRRRA